MYKSLNVVAAGWKKKYIKQAKREKISGSGGGEGGVEGWVLVEGCRGVGGHREQAERSLLGESQMFLRV